MRSIYLLATILGLICGWALHSMTNEASPLRYVLPFQPIELQVKAGDVAPLQVTRCNDTQKVLKYSTTHALASVEKGGPEIIFPSRTDVTLNPGCLQDISYINQVPQSTPPGRYYIYGVATVQGRFQSHEVPWFSVPFEVTKP